MNDVIHLLPDSVANQIAAGEVVQRPASVIKELVENSVDAGATQIKIILKDAGRTLIQIVDNGCGMSPTDARMAFERHSTSKISGASDLFSLTTMGFRGEALASICAVARVELRTMRRDDNMGTRIVIEGSHVETQEPDAGVPGSNFMVKNLFFNVPARRKFLKSDNVEMGHILREFERMALVNPNIEFTLIHNEVVLHQLLPSSFKERIVSLFGKSMDRQLVPVTTDTSMVTVNGFVSRPENARKRGALQYFMVNGRNMRHPYFHKAVLSCYEQLIPADEQPSYFINLSVDPSTIDVNIHPTKSEIKFEEEQAIWKILAAAIREALGRYNAVPSIEFDLTDAPEIPVFDPDAAATHEVELDPDYNPFADRYTGSAPSSAAVDTGVRPSRFNSEPRPLAGRDWEAMYREFERSRDESYEGMRASTLNSHSTSADEPAPAADDIFASTATIETSAPGVLQLKGRYILSPSRSGLMVVDQHRAHILVLYNRYLDLVRLDAMATQRVIFPRAVELSASQSATLRSMLPELAKLGFELAEPGLGCWEVEALPAVMNDVDQEELLLLLADGELAEGGEAVADIMRRRIALSMARAAAVKPGQVLSQAEMEHILSDLLKLSNPELAPDGSTVYKVIATDTIEDMFK